MLRPVHHRLGHGALCAAPTAPARRSSGGAPPWVCVAHLTAGGEAARQLELPSLLEAVPASQQALLVGDLNTLSSLDFPPDCERNVCRDRPQQQEALRALRASRKLTKKFLEENAPATRTMQRLFRASARPPFWFGGSAKAECCPWGAPVSGAGFRGCKHLPNMAGAGFRDLSPLSSGSAAPPPTWFPPPKVSREARSRGVTTGAPEGPPLRIDFALANRALVERCAAGDAATRRRGEPAASGAGFWAAAVDPAGLAAHGLANVSEHLPLQVVVGKGLPAGHSRQDEAHALELQQLQGAALLTAPPPPPRPIRTVPKPTWGGSDGGGGGGGGRSGSTSEVSEADIRAMPGGMPGGWPSSDAAGAACDALGAGGAKNLAHLHSEISDDGKFVPRCQALSGMLRMLGLNRRLRSCAVVGGSGILASHPRGAEIERHEAILRVNNCPVRGFEARVGGRTTLRFVNGPRSIMWYREMTRPAPGRRKDYVPPELLDNGHVVLWASENTASAIRRGMPSNSSVVRANTRFRRTCADKTFWSAAELDQHRSEMEAHRLEITFGFEAVAHALYSCDRVALYGFYLDPTDAKRKTNAAEGSKAMETPYHYYENQTYDKSAKDPWRPWTYKYHNFGLEHSKFRQLQKACWLRLVTDE